MLALALVLLALVAMLVVVSFAGSSEEAVIEFLNVTITTSVGGVFVAGVVAGLVALASAYALWISLRRLRKQRREVHDLRRRAEQATPHPGQPNDAEREPEPSTATKELPGSETKSARTDSESAVEDTEEGAQPESDTEHTSNTSRP